MKKVFTSEKIKFLKENASRHTKTLTDLFNKEFNTDTTTMQIQQALIYHKISYEKNLKLSPEMIEFLRLNALKYNTEILTDLFNKEFNTNTTTERLRRAMKLRSIKYIKSNRLNLKNHIGSEFVDKNNITYIKTSLDKKVKWVLKHRFLWEQANGSIPKNHCVIFLDRNKFNFELDNLELVSNMEYLLLNKYGFHSTDKEVTKAGLAVVRYRLLTLRTLTKGMSEKEKIITFNRINKEAYKRNGAASINAERKQKQEANM
jgi:hypothetical protein